MCVASSVERSAEAAVPPSSASVVSHTSSDDGDTGPSREGDDMSRNSNSRPVRRRDRSSSYSSQNSNTPAAKRTLVDHTYVDHLHDPERRRPNDGDGRGKRQRAPRGGVVHAFPEKLHEMLEHMDEEGLTHIVSWQPHGRCFLVHKKKEFVEDIMPRFFHQTKLTSFQRQLNLYGFVRLTAGRDRGAYYHELFLRGRADLSRRMIRTRVKGNGMKAASNPHNEPDFYAMESCLEDNSHCYSMEQEEEDCCPMTVEQEEDHDSHCSAMEEEEQKALEIVTSWSNEVPIVTPVSSPRPQIHFVEPPKAISFLEIPESNGEMVKGGPLIRLSPSIVVSEDPHTGDEVFFEGLKFRYLDHMDLQEDDLNPFIDQAGMMDYV